MGLSIMGLYFLLFPYFRSPLFPWTLLLLILLAIALEIAGIYFPSFTLLSGALRTAAILLFVAKTLFSLRKEPPPNSSRRVLISGLLYFLLASLSSLWHHAKLFQAPSQDDLAWQVATFQAPLRDLQVHGFILFSLFGVALAFFPSFYNRPPLSAARIKTMWIFLVTGLFSEILFFLLYRLQSDHLYASLLLLPWIFLSVGAALFSFPLLQRPLSSDPTYKFIATAVCWLLFSLAMLLLFPLYQWLLHSFSHAYYGAVRHAATVGFASLFLMGLLPKAIAGSYRPPFSLWTPFLLLNSGCLLRVVLQIVSDSHPLAFALLPVSALLEIAAFLIWGIALGRQMTRRKA